MSERKHITRPPKRVSQPRARILRKPERSDVGYRKPPVECQYQPGQSGNPSGRPRGRKSEEQMLRELLFRKVTVRENGKVHKITVFEAMLRRFAEDSLKGNTKSAAFLLARFAAATSFDQAAPQLSADDNAVVDAFLKDFRAKSTEADPEPGEGS